MDAMAVAPMFLGMPPIPLKGKGIGKVLKKAPKVAKPTGKSIAKELGVSHIGAADGLEYFNVAVPKGQATIATKGLDREALIKKIADTKKAFATPSKPLQMRKVIRKGDPKAAFSRARKLLKMWERRN